VTERSYVLGDLGLRLTIDGDELIGDARVTPNMWVPGTDALRISVLAAWVDLTLGYVVMPALDRRMGTTVELDVHLAEEIRGDAQVRLVAEVTKAGRTTMACRCQVLADGRRVGTGHGLFTVAPQQVDLPGLEGMVARFNALSGRGNLPQPFAEWIGCEPSGTGRCVLPCAPHLRNLGGVLTGAMLAAVAEEAVLATGPVPTALVSMQLRFLRAVRGGPAVASADVDHGLAEVEVRDATTDALAVLATFRARCLSSK
jgi:acyl-coenzyme A thioesterase PaaI-like protein